MPEEPRLDKELLGGVDLDALLAAGADPAVVKRLGEMIDAEKAVADQKAFSNTSDLFSSVAGEGIPQTVVDIGLYMVPGVGTARTAYDTYADFHNLATLDRLTSAQKAGYLLSGTGNALMTGMDFVSGGIGGRAAWLLAKPLMKALNGLKAGKKAVKSLSRLQRAVQVADKANRAGHHVRLFKNPALEFMYGYTKGKGIAPKLLHNVPRFGLPIGAIMYGEHLKGRDPVEALPREIAGATKAVVNSTK
jgi:hypothetical protein